MTRSEPAEYSVDLTYRIKYNTKDPVPLPEVIAALQSLQVLLKNTYVIASEVSNIEISGQQILIERVETGGLIEDVVVKLFFGNQENLMQFLEWMRESNMDKLLLGLIIGGGIVYAYKVLTKNNDAPSVVNNTTITNSTIISLQGLGSETPEIQKAVVQAIEKSTASKDDLARGALNFFSPSRAEKESTITLGNNDQLQNTEISSAEIQSIPTEYKPKKNNRIEELKKVKVKLRANDLDSRNSGWAGLIEDKTERVKIVLDPLLESSVLYSKSEVIADVSLEYSYKASVNQMIPNKMVIRNVYS